MHKGGEAMNEKNTKIPYKHKVDVGHRQMQRRARAIKLEIVKKIQASAGARN